MPAIHGALAWESCTEDDLVRRAQSHEDDAFLELMRRTRNASLRMARSILRDPAAAEDEVQDAYLKAWQHVGQFNGGARFATWIQRIVVNECLMRLRSFRRAKLLSLTGSHEREPLQVTDPALTVEDRLARQESAGILHREIRRLPPVLRSVLLLHVAEVPASEAAQHLGISVAATKSRLLRARRELKRRVAVSLASAAIG